VWVGALKYTPEMDIGPFYITQPNPTHEWTQPMSICDTLNHSLPFRTQDADYVTDDSTYFEFISEFLSLAEFTLNSYVSV